VDALTHVINFELPEVPETYVHRIGRTGRAGAEGIALSFCASDEIPSLRDINKLIGKKIPAQSHPFESLATVQPKPDPRSRQQGQWRPRQKNMPANSKVGKI
jgi:ATP-dependent RNA helicase RhlE